MRQSSTSNGWRAFRSVAAGSRPNATEISLLAPPNVPFGDDHASSTISFRFTLRICFPRRMKSEVILFCPPVYSRSPMNVKYGSGFLLPPFPWRPRPGRPERPAPFHAEEELAEGEDAALRVGPPFGLGVGDEGEEHHAAGAVSEEHREPEPGEEVG